MKNIRKISLISLLVIFCVTIIMSVCIVFVQMDIAYALQAEMQACLEYDDELKDLTCIPTVDEDFYDDEIIIILDYEHSGIEIKNSTYNFDEVLSELEQIDNINIKSIEELFSTEDEEIVSNTYRRMISLKLETPGKYKVIEAIEQLQKLDMVLSAEPLFNYTVVDEWVPADTYYANQWGLNGTFGVNVESAWDISKGSGIRVGIFERAIDSTHEDLAGRIAKGNFTPAAGTDASHGTHVGGIISAIADNNKGIAGISQATLYLLDRKSFASSLSFAANNGIKIINASYLYTISETNDSPASANSTHRQAIENYGSKGGLLICSAGNSGVDSDISPQYPSGYGDARLFPNVKNVISVGSINKSGNRSSFSNYGENSVQIYTPGESIYSTLPNNTYGNMSGTSMAAPHVTGAAALLLSYDQSLTGEEIKNILLNTADSFTVQNSNAKRLNINRAILSIFDSNRIGLQNVGHFAQGGNCSSSGSSGWEIELRNYKTTTLKVIYNKKMCFESDAKNWTGLTDIEYIEIPAGETIIVEVEENGFATHIAFSFVSGSKRYITYAHELNSSTNWLVPSMSTATYNSYTKNGMKVNIAGKNGGTWLIEFTNNTGSSRTFYYNKMMCFESDAQNWTGLSDVSSFTLASGSSKQLSISENAMATSITFSYKIGIDRYIFYAKNLDAKGTMSAYSNNIPTYYTQNGMKVAIVGKSGSTWTLQLTNNTGSSRTFYYNTKMCFESDAQNWKNLSNVLSFTLANGSTKQISISENALATSIAISYMNGNYRYVFYAKNLNATSCTMTAMSNTIDTTQSQECLAAGTIITLADGSQKAVETLTGDEMLLVWNMATGTFESTPILFVDSDPLSTYDIINLHFSDETSVKVIYEHGFWDCNLSRYIYLDENAGQYIGHWFNKQTTDSDGNLSWEQVQLTDVTITQEYTTAWSPVTYGHLCYYVNGMLSMPGGISGLMNIFEVDAETMTINQNSFASDIEEYGLFTYEEFYEFYPIPEEIFEAFNGQYLKVSIGKGLITYTEIGHLIERYSDFF